MWLDGFFDVKLAILQVEMLEVENKKLKEELDSQTKIRERAEMRAAQEAENVRVWGRVFSLTARFSKVSRSLTVDYDVFLLFHGNGHFIRNLAQKQILYVIDSFFVILAEERARVSIRNGSEAMSVGFTNAK